MMVILLGTLLPIWTIICFAIGVSMEQGTFALFPSLKDKRKRLEFLERQNRLLNEDLDKYQRSSDKWEKVAKTYQDLYPEPPKAFGYTINEESDRVAQSMSH